MIESSGLLPLNWLLDSEMVKSTSFQIFIKLDELISLCEKFHKFCINSLDLHECKN